MDEDLEIAVCDLKDALADVLDGAPDCRTILHALAELMLEFSPDDNFTAEVFAETQALAESGSLTVQ